MSGLKTERETADYQVARGVQWLDDNIAHWRTMVSQSTLNMVTPQTCVLGQLWQELMFDDNPSWSGVLEWVHQSYHPLDISELPSSDRQDALELWAKDLGFNSNGTVGYVELRAAWLRVLEQPTKPEKRTMSLNAAEVELVERHRQRCKLEKKITKLEKKLTQVEDELAQL